MACTSIMKNLKKTIEEFVKENIMQSRQESLLHLDFFISSILRQGIPYVVTGLFKL